jgi:DNA polymerase
MPNTVFPPHDCLSLPYENAFQAAQVCTNCELHSTRNKVVFSDGPVPCNILFIGEAPGADEDEQGIPFVGRAGKLLTQMLLSVGLKRPTDVYICNTLKCRPPGNRTPAPKEIEACLTYLVSQVSAVQPKIIVLLGSPAMKTILNPIEGITRVRGQWHNLRVNYQEDPVRVMTVFHPSYLLRNPSHKEGSPKWLTWQDLKAIRKELDLLR